MRRGTAALSSFAVLVAFAVPAARARAQEKPQGPVRVVGRVVSVLYEGVPAAEVWASDASGKQLARTVADGDGYFQLSRLPDVPLRVGARAAERVESMVEVTGAGTVRAATLVLEDGAELRGSVLLPDKSPAVGAAVIVTVAMQVMGAFHWSVETTTDAKGEWMVACAPLRAMKMRAFVPGRPLAEAEIAAGRDGAVLAAIPEGEVMQRRVVVKDAPAGQPVRVWCDLGGEDKRRQSPLPRAAVEALADANGVATLWDLPVPCDVRAAVDGHRSMPVCVMCRPRVERELEFTMSRFPLDLVASRTLVTGTLVDEVGQPIAGARLVGKLENTRGMPSTTAADGTFTLEVPVRPGVLCQVGLLAGDWCLGNARVASLGRDGGRWITMNADPQKPLRLDALRTGALRGTVLGPNGTPFGAASVQLTLRAEEVRRTPRLPDAIVETATNAAGVIDVAGLPPGRYQISASQLDRIGTGTVDIVAGGVAAPGALQFAPVGELRGVANGADGRALPSAGLWIHKKDPRAAARERALAAGMLLAPTSVVYLTDRHGNFRIPFVAEGEWAVMLQPPIGAKPRAVAVASSSFTVEAGKVARVEVTAPQ